MLAVALLFVMLLLRLIGEVTEVVDVDMFDGCVNGVLLVVVFVGDVKDVACIEHDEIVDGIGTLSAIFTGGSDNY